MIYPKHARVFTSYLTVNSLPKAFSFLPLLHPLRTKYRDQSIFFMSSTAQETYSYENLKSIKNALRDYTKETDIKLSKSPFATKLEKSMSPGDILQLLEEREKAFKEYREDNPRLTNFLKPTVKVLHGFSGILSNTTGLVSCKCHLVGLLTWPRQIPFPPVKLLFAGIDSLLDVRPLNTICPSKVPL